MTPDSRSDAKPSRRSGAARSTRGPAPARLTRRANSSGVASAAAKPSQRERLVDAAIELCARSGYQGFSIAKVSSDAGVSVATFYEQFADKEDLLLAAYRECAQRMFAHVPPLEDGEDWSEVAGFALPGLLEQVQSEPGAGRVLFIEALAGGPRIRKERERALQALEHRVQDFLQRAPEGRDTLDVPVLAVIGALRHIVSERLRSHAEDELPLLADDGVAWLRSYARAPLAELWSDGELALLPMGAGAPAPMLGTPARQLARLPPGRHGLPAGVIARSQRTRLILGTAEVMMAKGYANSTVGEIVADAGVARPVFYQYFSDKQDAFLEAQRHHTQYILDRCAQAYFAADAWPARVWRCLDTLIGLIVSSPAVSHLRLVECYSAGPAAIRQAEEITRSFTIFLQEGYRHRPEARPLSRLDAQAVAGAIFEVIQRHVAAGRLTALAARLPQLTYIALAPFTGAQEAIGLVEQMREEHLAARRS